MNYVMLGPPGSGKGTQATRLSSDLKMTHVSTGNMLREAVQEKSELGKKVEEILKKGGLVPDGLMVEIVSQRLSQKDCGHGFILDGFPRTVPQAERLDRFLKEKNLDLTGILIDVPENLCVERLTRRKTCGNCGRSYNDILHVPKKEGFCDFCGSPLIQRSDDRTDTARERLKVYQLHTEPVVAYYAGSSRLLKVDGYSAPDAVFKKLKELTGAFPNAA